MSLSVTLNFNTRFLLGRRKNIYLGCECIGIENDTRYATGLQLEVTPKFSDQGSLVFFVFGLKPQNKVTIVYPFVCKACETSCLDK